VTQREMNFLISGEKEWVRFNKRYLQKNGSIVWIDVSSSLRRDKQGNPLYFVTTLVDINERKRADDELKKSEEKYRNILRMCRMCIMKLCLMAQYSKSVLLSRSCRKDNTNEQI